MFKGFAHVWTPLLPAVEVRKKPVPVTLAGEKLVLFRDDRGRVGALIDQCPHRGVSLSLGEVTEDGCLRCPFHGWSFRTDGACAHVPFNPMPAEKLGRYAATSLPVREVAGLVWVFTGLDAAGTEPLPPSGLIEPRWHVSIYHEEWQTHWTRVMENMLDMPHLPFIHRRTIGREMRKTLGPTTEMRLDVEPTAWGASFRTAIDGVRSGGELRWRRPNGMELLIEPESLRVHVYCVPVDDRRTRLILTTARTFLSWGPLAPLLDYSNRKILLEDRSVVESSQPSEVPPAGDELSVATDGPTLHFRRHYYRELRSSSATLVPGSRLVRRATEASESVPLPSALE